MSSSELAKMKFLDGIYLSVFVRDIEKYLGSENSILLERLIKFLASSIGNRISVNKLKNFLVSNGWINSGTHNERIQRLLNATIHAYLFYPVTRFNISGKKELTTLGKYYIAVTGIRSNIIEFKSEDRGLLLENIVYLELKRRNYQIHVGQFKEKEIDFVILKNGKTSYIQVCETLENPDVRKREIDPLRKINNAYRRIVLTTDIDPVIKHVEGIDIINIVDFLLDKKIMD